jgi:hypothetical protein
MEYQQIITVASSWSHTLFRLKLCSLAEDANILEETGSPIFRMEERKCKPSFNEGYRYRGKKWKGNVSCGDSDDTDFPCNCTYCPCVACLISWRFRQQVFPKRLCLSIRQHGITQEFSWYFHSVVVLPFLSQPSNNSRHKLGAVTSVPVESFPTGLCARYSNRQLSLCNQNTKGSNK